MKRAKVGPNELESERDSLMPMEAESMVHSGRVRLFSGTSRSNVVSRSFRSQESERCH